MKKYKFYKELDKWFIDLPEWIEKGNDISELEMVAGADKMLDIFSKGNNEVYLEIDENYFPDSDVLIFIKPNFLYGGGYYFMEMLEGEIIIQAMWLCSVTDFVFGKLPKEIYIKRA